MFPLCCRGLRNNLKLACLYIGLLELVLCVARFGIFIDHLTCNKELKIFTILSLPILVLTVESIFFIQLSSAVMITVGSDRSPGFLIAFMVLSATSVILFIPILIVCGVFGSYHMLYAWSILMAPEFYFYLIVIYYMKHLRAVGPKEDNGEYISTEV